MKYYTHFTQNTQKDIARPEQTENFLIKKM